MRPRWADLDARAAGLSTRLLSRAELVDLAHRRDLGDVAARLVDLERAPTLAADAASLERALRRQRAERMAILARWAGPRTEVLAVVFEDEDRRSLQALLRRTAAGRAGPAPLAGLIPTPALPERALATLAQQEEPGALAALLATWGHPLGPPLLEAAAPRAPLAVLEQALHAAFARRAVRAARRGDATLREHAATLVDLDNARALLVGLRQDPDQRDPEAWLPGGDRIDETAYAAILRSETVEDGAEALGEALRDADLREPLLSHPPGDPRVELDLLRALVARLVARARREPLGTAPVLAFALRQRAEAVDLRTVLWGVALGAPPSTLERLLVTP